MPGFWEFLFRTPLPKEDNFFLIFPWFSVISIKFPKFCVGGQTNWFLSFIKCDYVDYIKTSKEDFSNHCIAIVCPIAFLGWVAKDFKELCKDRFFQFSTNSTSWPLTFLGCIAKNTGMHLKKLCKEGGFCKFWATLLPDLLHFLALLQKHRNALEIIM